MQPADRQNADDTRRHCGGQRGVFAGHAADQMTAGGMPRQMDRAFDPLCSGGDRGADHLCDLRDARLGRQHITGQRDGPARRPRALGQMRPGRFVEFQPVAAMDKHREALWRRIRPEQVEFLPGMIAIGDIDLGPCDRCPVGRRRLVPFRRVVRRAGDVGAIGVCVVPVPDLFGHLAPSLRRSGAGRAAR